MLFKQQIKLQMEASHVQERLQKCFLHMQQKFTSNKMQTYICKSLQWGIIVLRICANGLDLCLHVKEEKLVTLPLTYLSYIEIRQACKVGRQVHLIGLFCLVSDTYQFKMSRCSDGNVRYVAFVFLWLHLWLCTREIVRGLHSATMKLLWCLYIFSCRIGTFGISIFGSHER